MIGIIGESLYSVPKHTTRGRFNPSGVPLKLRNCYQHRMTVSPVPSQFFLVTELIHVSGGPELVPFRGNLWIIK